MSIINLRFFDQTRFGGPEAAQNERGNCDKTCLATLVGYTPDQIPDYQELEGDAWWQARQTFLRERGFVIVTFGPDVYNEISGPCIAIGKSPRGEWNHSVLANLSRNANGHMVVDYLHDPHMSRLFISGDPIQFDFVFRLVPYKKGEF